MFSPYVAELAAQSRLETLRAEAESWSQTPRTRVRTRLARYLQHLAVRLEPNLRTPNLPEAGASRL